MKKQQREWFRQQFKSLSILGRTFKTLKKERDKATLGMPFIYGRTWGPDLKGLELEYFELKDKELRDYYNKHNHSHQVKMTCLLNVFHMLRGSNVFHNIGEPKYFYKIYLEELLKEDQIEGLTEDIVKAILAHE